MLCLALSPDDIVTIYVQCKGQEGDSPVWPVLHDGRVLEDMFDDAEQGRISKVVRERASWRGSGFYRSST